MPINFYMTQNIKPSDFKNFYKATITVYPDDAVIEQYISEVRDLFDAFTFERANNYELKTFQKSRWDKAMIYATLYRMLVENVDGIEGNGIPKGDEIGINEIKLGDLTIKKSAFDKYTTAYKSSDDVEKQIGTQAMLELERSGLLCTRISCH